MKSVLTTKFNNTIEQIKTNRLFFIYHVCFFTPYRAKNKA